MPEASKDGRVVLLSRDGFTCFAHGHHLRTMSSKMHTDSPEHNALLGLPVDGTGMQVHQLLQVSSLHSLLLLLDADRLRRSRVVLHQGGSLW